jgi:hypothetical protein
MERFDPDSGYDPAEAMDYGAEIGRRAEREARRNDPKRDRRRKSWQQERRAARARKTAFLDDM